MIVRPHHLIAFALAMAAAVSPAAPADETEGEYVTSLQLPAAKPPHGGFGLDVTPQLLGRFGLTARDVLIDLAPQLAGVTLRAKSAAKAASGDAVHEEYELWYGAVKLDDAYLSLHHHKNRLALLRAKLPEYRLPAAPFSDEDFLPLASLGLDAPEPGHSDGASKVVASSSGFAVPAWNVRRFDKLRGQTVERVIDAQTGAVLREATYAFDAASVYEKNPRDAGVISVDLPGLTSSGFLDGNHFSVYAPNEKDARAQSSDGQFNFRPDDEALNFDQVQAYYTATKALAFFTDKFGYDIGDAHLVVRVNDLVGGRTENAAYLPAPEGPEILIGRGGEHLSGLARDTDVIIHEFSHHVIYAHLTTSSGESGLIHEGTADYFAYAINDDPYLAETVVANSPYLRTAALAAGMRYDGAPAAQDNHTKGQYWSAVLWELRQRLGSEIFDKMVYDSLAYLGPRSGLKDAFNALLNADRDLRPLADGDAEQGTYGQDKCDIINAGVTRGFAVALEGHDAATCGLDLAALASESRALSKSINDPEKKSGRQVSITVFGKKCSTVGDGDPDQGALILLWLLSLPVFVGLISTVNRTRAARGWHDHGP